MGTNKPLIHYYARLIRKGDYELEKIPEHMREDVLAKAKELDETEGPVQKAAYEVPEEKKNEGNEQ